jgi:hypothetical protein
LGFQRQCHDGCPKRELRKHLGGCLGKTDNVLVCGNGYAFIRLPEVVALGGLRAGLGAMGSREDAIERAEQLRPVFAELADLSARKIAAALNERKIATPAGGVWHAATVIRVQKRLGLA